VNVNERGLSETADRIYHALKGKGVDVILDDRDERAGVKFKDADLIGIPFRVTVGSKKLAEGKVEIMFRRTRELVDISIDAVEAFVLSKIGERM
jgi:prolyl-tRNA synthetase